MYIVLTHFYGYVKNFLEFVMAYMTVMRYSPDAMEQCSNRSASYSYLSVLLRYGKKNTLTLCLSACFFIIYANQLCSTLQMGAF